MKGLLLKDLFVLKKQFRYMLCLLVLYCLLPGMSATAFAMLYIIMLPITAMSYDERCKWDRLAAMMPYSSRDLVLSKYVLSYIGTFGVLLLSTAAYLVETVIAQTPIAASEFYAMAVMLCLTLLMQAVNLPLMIHFGVEKGRMLYILTLALLAAAAYGLEEVLPALLEKLTLVPVVPCLLLLLVTALANLLSIHMAVRSYQKQEH